MTRLRCCGSSPVSAIDIEDDAVALLATGAAVLPLQLQAAGVSQQWSDPAVAMRFQCADPHPC